MAIPICGCLLMLLLITASCGILHAALFLLHAALLPRPHPLSSAHAHAHARCAHGHAHTRQLNGTESSAASPFRRGGGLTRQAQQEVSACKCACACVCAYTGCDSVCYPGPLCCVCCVYVRGRYFASVSFMDAQVKCDVGFVMLAESMNPQLHTLLDAGMYFPQKSWLFNVFLLTD